MSRRPWWLTHLALGAAASVIFAACQAAPSGGASPTPAAATGTPAASPAATSPAATSPAATGTAGGPPAGAVTRYPEQGDAPCGGDSPNGQPYTGEFKRIEATDDRTVVFTLCAPDVAFLSKVAFTSFAINDSAYLQAHVPDQSIVSNPNGTGPFRFREWRRGEQVILDRNDAYWGDQKALAATGVFRWNPESAQRRNELEAGTVDGIDNPSTDDIEAIQQNTDLTLYPRAGLNVFYLGFNNTSEPFDDERVRQAIAQGIDRQRIVDTFYPEGSEVASHFTPCEIQFGCEGPAWYDFNLDAAKQLLADAGFPNGFQTQLHLRDVPRGYLPEPTVVAREIQAQLKQNLNIDAAIDVQESTTFIDNADAGKLPGIHMLGWGADYPDPTNFLDYHFGSGASAQFGEKFEEITEPLEQGATTIEEAERREAYAQANEAIRTLVPMVPIAHGASATAFRADVQGAHASPLGNESLAVMSGGADDQIVFMQNAEPPGLYCADESDGEALRVCEQVMEALYAYEVGGTAAIPALAEQCVGNDTADVWTCTLRQGVTFHDGSTLDVGDVVLSYAVQWDAEHPLHKGRDNSFTYFPGLWGGFLNAPPPEEEEPAAPTGTPAGTPGGTPAGTPAGTPGESPSPAESPAESPSPAGSPAESPSPTGS